MTTEPDPATLDDLADLADKAVGSWADECDPLPTAEAAEEFRSQIARYLTADETALEPDEVKVVMDYAFGIFGELAEDPRSETPWFEDQAVDLWSITSNSDTAAQQFDAHAAIIQLELEVGDPDGREGSLSCAVAAACSSWRAGTTTGARSRSSSWRWSTEPPMPAQATCPGGPRAQGLRHR